MGHYDHALIYNNALLLISSTLKKKNFIYIYSIFFKVELSKSNIYMALQKLCIMHSDSV